MAVECYTRKERNGINVIFPLEGPKKQNCLLVNDSVRAVFDEVSGGTDLATIVRLSKGWAQESYQQAVEQWDGENQDTRPQPPDDQKVSFDLYRTLLSLRDHGICEYAFEELLDLLPQGREIHGATQLMPVCAAVKTSEFLAKVVTEEDESVQAFYCAPIPSHLVPAYFDPELVVRRHLSQEEVYFVHLDKQGEVEACTIIGGFAMQPQSLMAAFIAARHPSSEQFIENVGSHFSRVCGLLSVVTLSAMIRIQYAVGEMADVHLAEGFMDVIAEMGFRKSFDLPHELSDVSGLVAYDKLLV